MACLIDCKSCTEVSRKYQNQLFHLFRLKVKTEADLVLFCLNVGFCVHEVNDMLGKYMQAYQEDGFYYLLWRYMLPHVIRNKSDEEIEALFVKLEKL